MPGDPDRHREVGVDRDVAGGGESTPASGLGVQQSRQIGQDEMVRGAGEHQRAPSDSQVDAQGGLIGPVPHDVADHGPHVAFLGLDDVEEVAAQNREIVPRLVVDSARDQITVQPRIGEQAALQTRVLS